MKFNVKQFDQYREDNRLEVKQALGGLPGSLWSTYSSFANCYGGVIILGVSERKDGSWQTVGLKKENARKLTKAFWDIINNPQKVSVNLLTEKDVQTYEVGDDVVVAIHVPRAPRQDRPVYLNNDPIGQTYRRSFEGDYRCSRGEIGAMFRDQSETSMDMEILDNIPMDYLNPESIRGYRNLHKVVKDGHPFGRLADEEFLRSVGAAGVSERDGKYHPTGAGLLMFGDEYNIVRRYREYFLDYRETLDPTIRWTDRVQSSSGEWSGNVFDFFYRVYNKIIKEVKTPFKLVGAFRVDDTPVHKALREALVNCLTNADFDEPRGVVIKLENHTLTLENPGGIRVGKRQMLLGGVSDSRNKGLMKLFNLIDIGERAGSGVPGICNVWEDNGFAAPEIIEEFNPGRTKLILSFEKKEAGKSDESKEQSNKRTSTASKTVAKKGKDNIPKWASKSARELLEKSSAPKCKTIIAILSAIRADDKSSSEQIAESVDLSARTVRRYLQELRKYNAIRREGSDKNGFWIINE